MPEQLTTEFVQQFSSGYSLVLPFTDQRSNTSTPVNGGSDTWKVVMIRPDGTGLEKTTGLTFPDNAVAAIGVTIDALDLNQKGLYYYQVIRTTAGAVARSDVRTFTVNTSLPLTVSGSVPTSPLENYFAIFDAVGALTTNQLRIDGGVLKFGTAVVVFSNQIVTEVPNGVLNGSNAAFTTDFSFVPETVQVFVNGIRQTLVDDYTTAGTTNITLVVAPASGEHLLVTYVKV